MIEYLVLLANVVVVSLGSVAISVCFKGYRLNKSFSMMCLTLGFSLIVAGPVAGMALLAFTGLGFWEVQAVESSFIAFGFVYIVHSIFTKRN